jgi:hypothetical protein
LLFDELVVALDFTSLVLVDLIFEHGSIHLSCPLVEYLLRKASIVGTHSIYLG